MNDRLTFAERVLADDHLHRLMALAVAEDIGSGDVTTTALVDPKLMSEARLLAKEDGVLAGLAFATALFDAAGFDLKLETDASDGDAVRAGQEVGRLRGRAAEILIIERTLLNILQRLSGIATATRRHRDLVADFDVAILETRKTIPGWRLLDKYAVLCGGGALHRLGLFDQILAKENHFALCRRSGWAEDFRGALDHLMRHRPANMTVEVEVENLDEFEAALEANVDIILLDNMSCEDMRRAVSRRDEREGKKILLEASGGITAEGLRDVAATGVDRISLGALTHSVKALDLSLLIETPSSS